jgi:hypothetical protein
MVKQQVLDVSPADRPMNVASIGAQMWGRTTDKPSIPVHPNQPFLIQQEQGAVPAVCHPQVQARLKPFQTVIRSRLQWQQMKDSRSLPHSLHMHSGLRPSYSLGL